MLHISDSQLAGLEASVRERMIRRATSTAQARLAAAGTARASDQIAPVAAEMQAFAEARDLREQASLDALLELRLSSWWRDPLPELAAMFLTRENFPEPTRIQQFRQALVQPQVTLIDLDAPPSRGGAVMAVASTARPRATPPPPPKSVACQTCPEKKKPPKKIIRVRVSVFFDGTLNNRTNTAARLDYEARKRKGDRVRSPGSGSYEGDYSNVAKLEQTLAEDQPGYDHAIKLYVEGIGTTDNESDTLAGYAFGQGATGVTGKVERGLSQLIPQIVSLVDDPANTIVQYVHLDSFGFSRGAAAARNFVHQALVAGARRVKPGLTAAGISVGDVKMRFVGLYDTVASVGSDIGSETVDDVADLKLTAISQAEKVVQLAAAEEHRKNFPLTNINSAGSGLQIFLPGVHSDVGGGYVDYGAETDYQIFDVDTAWAGATVKAALERERGWLIAQGWYQAGEIEPVNFWNELRVNRTGIRNTYARIPLHILAKHAKTLQLRFMPDLQARHPVPPELGSIHAMLDGEGANTPHRFFRGSQAGWHQTLRHGYLHFSSCYGDPSNGPRWTGGDRLRGRRERRIHDG